MKPEWLWVLACGSAWVLACASVWPPSCPPDWSCSAMRVPVAVSVSLSVSAVLLLLWVIAVAPGHVQVAVDRADQHQVHLLHVHLDGAETGLAEPAEMV